MQISNDVLSKISELNPNYFPNAFPKIFSWDELERLLNLRPFVNADRCRLINNKSYSWQRQVWLSDVNTFPPSILDPELRENVCYLSDASRVNKDVNSICAQLEDTFDKSAVDAHIYFTVADNLDGGFGIHWDFSHNLIVQIEGSTRIQIWNKIAGDDVIDRGAISIPEDPMIDTVMNPGDAVFVPLRYYHRALSQTKRLSISFPISLNNDFAKQDRHWIKLF